MGPVARVQVDKQGRMVLPQWLRRRLVTAPGEVMVRETPDGVLLTPVAPERQVEWGADGLPVLRLGRPATNDEVLQAIDHERAER